MLGEPIPYPLYPGSILELAQKRCGKCTGRRAYNTWTRIHRELRTHRSS